jgi:hypothetical protein
MKLDIWPFFFENLLSIFEFHSNLKKKQRVRKFLRTFMTLSRWILLKVRKVSDKSCTKIQKNYFRFNNFFFSKIMPFMRCGKVWYRRTGYWRQYNMAYAVCMLVKLSQEYTKKLIIFNIYCFPTATTVTRTRLTLTLYYTGGLVHKICSTYQHFTWSSAGAYTPCNKTPATLMYNIRHATEVPICWDRMICNKLFVLNQRQYITLYSPRWSYI